MINFKYSLDFQMDIDTNPFIRMCSYTTNNLVHKLKQDKV